VSLVEGHYTQWRRTQKLTKLRAKDNKKKLIKQILQKKLILRIQLTCIFKAISPLPPTRPHPRRLSWCHLAPQRCLVRRLHSPQKIIPICSSPSGVLKDLSRFVEFHDEILFAKPIPRRNCSTPENSIPASHKSDHSHSPNGSRKLADERCHDK